MRFCSLYWALQVNAGIISHIRPWLILSISFTIHVFTGYSIIYALESSLMMGLLNKLKVDKTNKLSVYNLTECLKLHHHQNHFLHFSYIKCIVKTENSVGKTCSTGLKIVLYPKEFILNTSYQIL
jgi:hypothetical protein